MCVQFVLSLVAWALLGFVAAGAVGVLLGACFALAWPVALWNGSVLSESLSITLFAASLAATLWLWTGWNRRRFAAWCAVVVVFAFTRSTNVFLLPFLVVPFAALGKRQTVLTAAVVAVVFGLWGAYGNTVGAPLRETSLLNVYLNRIVHNDQKRPYFVERGMPVDRDVAAFVDRRGAVNKDELFERSPQFAAWFKDKGASTYRAWLLSHSLSFAQAWSVLVDNVNYAYPEYDDGLQARAASTAMTRYYTAVYLPWWVMVVFAVVMLAVLALPRRITFEAVLAVALMAGAYVQAYVGYHGDATEMARHCILALVVYKVAVFVIAVWGYRVIRERVWEGALLPPGAKRVPKKKAKTRQKRKRR
jgi:hypothetical protein